MSIEQMKQEMTSAEAKALALAEPKWWESLPARDVALAQLDQDRLCMDFGDFHEAVEKAIGRSVWSHEFVNHEHLAREIDPSRPEPSSPRKTLADMMTPGTKAVVVKA